MNGSFGLFVFKTVNVECTAVKSYRRILNCFVTPSFSKSFYSSSYKTADNQQDNDTTAKCDGFSGHIPLDDLRITYSRSSGPGGQNVNKVNSKVEVRFHVASAKWISNAVRERLLKREFGRMTKDGYLVVSSEKTRRQPLNQADCLERIRTMITDAANDKPFEPSAEQVAVQQSRKEKARLATLHHKRLQSQVKRNRRVPPSGGDFIL